MSIIVTIVSCNHELSFEEEKRNFKDLACIHFTIPGVGQNYC